jgi:hypothetical protein
MSRESTLNTLVNKLSDQPFEYGINDCFTFTNALVEAWHGKSFKDCQKYKTKEEAMAYIAANGSLQTLIMEQLGYPVNAENCENGDVVTAKVGPDGSVAFGFVYDGHSLFKCNKGVKKLKLSHCLQGWRIR